MSNNLNTAEEIIAFIKNSTKKTPVKAYINGILKDLLPQQKFSEVKVHI